MVSLVDSEVVYWLVKLKSNPSSINYGLFMAALERGAAMVLTSKSKGIFTTFSKFVLENQTHTRNFVFFNNKY